jgi:hypothetical protein
VSVPHVAGDRDHPEWWTEEDQQILSGALAELANMPRPAYIERDHDRLVYTPITLPKSWGRRGREIGAWIVLVATCAAVLLLASWAGEKPAPPPCAGDPAGCADFVSFPATYAPPGPNGGAR